MNLKQRFSFIFSGIFSLVLATVMLTVYFLFAKSRKDEFTARLAEKAETSAKILIAVKEVDYNTQKTIDRNSVSKLYKENTEIFNDKRKLIYDTNHSIAISWKAADFDRVVDQHYYVEREGPYDVVGLAYVYDGHFYYVMSTAEDDYGNRKLNYLKYLLFGAFIAGTSLVWLISFRLSKQVLQPLDNFRNQIQDITDHNLNIRLAPAKREDEINALAGSFNQMMDRIDSAYNRQKEFTGNASHELRTPLTRIAAQLENILDNGDLDPSVRSGLTGVAGGLFQLSEIVSSLVALAGLQAQNDKHTLQALRLDELVFAAASEVSKTYTDLKLHYDVENNTGSEVNLNILGDETLLKIVLTNLFKNAYLYSANQVVTCIISQQTDGTELRVINIGEVPDVNDTATLFTTFYRGSNVHSVPGSGIGLSIVKRVLDFHHAPIRFDIMESQTNQVSIKFPQNA